MNDSNNQTPAVASSDLFGFCVWRTKYSGGKHGDTVLWTDEEAAKFKLAEHKSKCGEWEEAKMERMKYIPLGGGKAVVGRTLYELLDTTRRELVRGAALAKLNNEEKEALGLLPNSSVRPRA